MPSWSHLLLVRCIVVSMMDASTILFEEDFTTLPGDWSVPNTNWVKSSEDVSSISDCPNPPTPCVALCAMGEMTKDNIDISSHYALYAIIDAQTYNLEQGSNEYGYVTFYCDDIESHTLSFKAYNQLFLNESVSLNVAPCIGAVSLKIKIGVISGQGFEFDSFWIANFKVYGTLTNDPTTDPTNNPTFTPTTSTETPTKSPTKVPTNIPTYQPTKYPTRAPTNQPTYLPSNNPSMIPSDSPSPSPSLSPTSFPTDVPTSPPSIAPSNSPSASPSMTPTHSPTTCYDNGTPFSDDGYEESVANQISNLDFIYAIFDANINVTDAFASGYYKQSIVFDSIIEQELVCSGTASCSLASISFINNSICNLLCNGLYSCSETSIHIEECVHSHIICNGQGSCDGLIINVSSNSNDQFQLDCGASTSCNNVQMNVYGNAVTETNCIGLNGCDNIKINVAPDNYKNSVLKMISYSSNVVFSNGFGYKEFNGTSAEYVLCNEKNRFIKYDPSLNTNTAATPVITAEFESGLFPCDDLKIECFASNVSTSTCNMGYSVDIESFEIVTPSPLATCYWVQVADVIAIDCVGDCVTSPTYSPTNAPTNSPTHPTMIPTNDPTVDPTFDPTTDPTVDPTIDPTVVPTMDPTIDPTMDPTVDPTQIPSSDPTTDPTFDPTTDPTQTPTDAPTIAPSQAPTSPPTTAPSNNPSRSPSYVPSSAPTDAPTQNPSIAPSDAPSFAPSLSPSVIPTDAPTFSPSNAPTRLPTVDVDDREKGYDYYIDVDYSISNLSVSNKRYIVANTGSVIGKVEEILERNYFDDEILRYNAFWIDVKQVNDVDIKDENERLSEYDLDINNIDVIPMILESRIETTWELAGFIITKSQGDTFRDKTQSELQTFFNASSLHFEVLIPDEEDGLVANPKFTTAPPTQTEDTAALVLSVVIVSVGVIISVAAFIFNKISGTKVDNAAFWMPLLVSLNIYDFVSDVNLSVTIMGKVTFSAKSMNELTFWLGIGSIFFIVLPFGSNLLYAMRIRRQPTIKANPAARSYFTKLLAQFILMCVFCAGTYPIIGLTSSRIFGLEVFNAGLLSSELHRLSKIKIRSTIYLENGPQLIIQILYSAVQQQLETATILAFVASLLSVIASVIIYQAQSDVSDEYIISKYFIRLYTKSNIDANEQGNIKKYKGLKERLGDSLSAIFGVSNKSIEIGYVTLNDHGCIIHLQHSIFKEDLESLRNKLFQNQMQRMIGYNIQITEDLYIENMFELYRTKILSTLVQHFHFDTSKKGFAVRYYKRLDDTQKIDGKSNTLMTSGPSLLNAMKKKMTPNTQLLGDAIKEDMDLEIQMQPMVEMQHEDEKEQLIHSADSSLFVKEFESFKTEMISEITQRMQSFESRFSNIPDPSSNSNPNVTDDNQNGEDMLSDEIKRLITNSVQM